MKTLKNAISLKIFGEPGHIAEAVQFIIKNDYMTGATIDINGGIYMY